jgi:hypothetical protein
MTGELPPQTERRTMQTPDRIVPMKVIDLPGGGSIIATTQKSFDWAEAEWRAHADATGEPLPAGMFPGQEEAE